MGGLPPKLQKPCRGQNARVAADILRVAANISRVVVDKAVWEAKSCWPKNFFFTFLKIFLSFLGFSRVKIHFFQKVLKKWSSFRKKLLYFFPLLGGPQTPKWKFPLFIFIFFLNPSLTHIIVDL